MNTIYLLFGTSVIVDSLPFIAPGTISKLYTRLRQPASRSSSFARLAPLSKSQGQPEKKERASKRRRERERGRHVCGFAPTDSETAREQRLLVDARCAAGACASVYMYVRLMRNRAVEGEGEYTRRLVYRRSHWSWAKFITRWILFRIYEHRESLQPSCACYTYILIYLFTVFYCIYCITYICGWDGELKVI